MRAASAAASGRHAFTEPGPAGGNGRRKRMGRGRGRSRPGRRRRPAGWSGRWSGRRRMAGDRLGRRTAIGHPGVIERSRLSVKATRSTGGCPSRTGPRRGRVEEHEIVGVADLDQAPAQGQGVDADPVGIRWKSGSAFSRPARQDSVRRRHGRRHPLRRASRQGGGGQAGSGPGRPRQHAVGRPGGGPAELAVVVVRPPPGRARAQLDGGRGQVVPGAGPWLVTLYTPWRRSTARRPGRRPGRGRRWATPLIVDDRSGAPSRARRRWVDEVAAPAAEDPEVRRWPRSRVAGHLRSPPSLERPLDRPGEGLVTRRRAVFRREDVVVET